MGGFAGGIGTLAGLAGSSKARKNYRTVRGNILEREKSSIGDIEGGQSDLWNDTLLGPLRDLLMKEMGAGSDGGGVAPYEDRAGLFQTAMGNLQQLQEGPFGLSDPRVRDQIYNSAIEGTLTPQVQGAQDNLASNMASRGMSRSGLSNDANRQLSFDSARTAAMTRRDIDTQGALAAKGDILDRMKATQGLLGQGQGIASQQQQMAGQLGTNMQGLAMQLLQMLTGTRMGTAQLLGSLGSGPDQMSDLSSNLFKFGNMTNR